MMAGEFETVYTVTAYYDGILAGIADFRGVPHVFTLEDLAESEPFAVYRLRPISRDSFASSGLTESPDIWSASAQTESMVEVVSRAEDPGVVARGEFAPVEGTPALKPDLQVRWLPL
jgi:hypothetical protein